MTTSEKNTATFTHLSTLSQYFIPFGNYIFPIIIWGSNKNKSEFVDYNGKQVLNFQLSLLLYSILLGLIAIPIFIYTVFNSISFHSFINNPDFTFNHFDFGNISGVVLVALLAVFILICLKFIEFFLIIYASIKASNGEEYKYPLTIPFIK